MEQRDIVNIRDNSVKQNTRYEILTVDGFKPFWGIREITKSDWFKISFTDGTTTGVSGRHLLQLKSGKFVQTISTGEGALLAGPGHKVIRSIERVEEPVLMYDIIETPDHTYITDGFVSHNCDFLTSGDTFFDVEDMSFYEQTYQQDPVERRGMDGNLWIWEYPDYSKSYMVSADVARGDGGDNSAFQVWDIEACTQVAEYMGQLPPREFGAVLTSIATEYNNALLVVENANVGFSAIEEIMARQYPNLYYGDNSNTLVETAESYAMKSDKGRLTPGFNTSTKTRPVLLAKYYDYVRQKAVIIRSKRLLLEMRTFVWLNGKAQGAQGYHDDLVMSAGIGLYVRDTALRLRQQGMDLSRAQMSSFTNLNKRAPVVVQNSYVPNPYEMKNPYGQVEDITWLLH